MSINVDLQDVYVQRVQMHICTYKYTIIKQRKKNEVALRFSQYLRLLQIIDNHFARQPIANRNQNATLINHVASICYLCSSLDFHSNLDDAT